MLENLQRYDYRVEGDPRKNIPILIEDEYGGFCKFNEVMEASLNSQQQLKAAIALLKRWKNCYISESPICKETIEFLSNNATASV